ncbi:carboxy-S-adenosyl-L-methionine synthase CmoA [Campylobacter sp. MIT 19-121]|uniref:carboxy-S-adenosyl-L-methionine synthase CmoA n=1 Tax=Campylobacter sp. MIT 19-121 TaxID=2703906 RepID=UPI00138A6858|nr:carboxy-S-adenosyl-L-methionine synthase CmoA [Campylobacter sp. MIT 19-121]
MKDELFRKISTKQFEFDESVASVFDDMIQRSVPFYKQNVKLITQLIAHLAPKKAQICDLGCSTASLLFELFSLQKDFVLCGVDEAEAMLSIARKKAKAFKAEISFLQGNLNELEFKQHDIFIANYTLQFIRPLQRQALVDKIYHSLNPKGFFILSEKIVYEDAVLAKQMIDIYAEYKQEQGYSHFEIAKKREALENVLVPYSEKENITMLENSGFKKIESFFKWGNFESFIAFKD